MVGMKSQSPQCPNGPLNPNPAGENGLFGEELLTFAQAARLVPRRRGGRPCAVSTVWRWALKGLRGPDGKRVYLEYVRVGGMAMTTRQALERFFRRLTATEQPPNESRPEARQQRRSYRRNEQRRQQIARAEAICRAAGI